MIITVDDVAAIGYCRRGCRELAKRYGFDWSDFVMNGIDSSRLEPIDDAMVKEIIEHVKKVKGTSNG